MKLPLMILTLPTALVSVGNAQAQEEVAPRFHLEGGHGRIDVAPTILDRFPFLISPIPQPVRRSLCDSPR